MYQKKEKNQKAQEFYTKCIELNPSNVNALIGLGIEKRKEEKYNVCLISPLCYEKGYQVKFSSALGDGLFLINPITTLNPWILDFPFNQSNPTIGNTVNCIVGRLSIEENLYNINRQKRQLIQSIQYQNRGQTEIDILENRLSTRYKRVGMATFGRYARFV